MSEFAVDVQNLSKWYGLLKAVDDVSFRVEKGSSFGLLGLNGAGKTTTFKMLVSLIRPDEGTAVVAGYDVVKEPMEVRARIGYVAENPMFYPRMTTIETLLYLCRLLDIPAAGRDKRIDKVLDMVGLTDKKHVYVGGYSRGMRHRLGLAQALLSEPQVLFLDEPTLGLDPLGAKNMRELIVGLKQEHEVTVLMSSHVLPEVEAICDEVAVFDHGRVVAVDTIQNLRSTAADNKSLELVMDQPNKDTLQVLKSIPGVTGAELSGTTVNINVAKGMEVRAQIIREIISNSGEVLSFGLKESSLEDILLRLVNAEADSSVEYRDNLDITTAKLNYLLKRWITTRFR